MPSAELVGLLHDDKPLPDVDTELWQEWRARFQRHLDRFGHTVYNLDFANAVPADDPAPLIDTLRFYLRGEGTDPNERQAGSAARREQATRGRARPGWTRRGGRCSTGCCAGRRASPRSARTRSATSAWPGRSCAGCCWSWDGGWSATGVIDRPEDVFWLRRDEMLAAPGRPHATAVAAPQGGRGAAGAGPLRRSCCPSAAGTGCSRT